jgi:BASS family bile acid:Na+ symporter
MQKVRSYILPIAIVLGLLLHRFCAAFSVAVPYLIFSILLLTFTAVDVRKLKFSPMFVWILLFQIVVSISLYALLKTAGASPVVAEGVMMAALCPVASSVAVVSCMLGADRQTVTSFTIIGNLVMSVVAPAYFTLIGVHPEMTFMASFLSILRRVGVVIGLPFFIALALQLWLPKVNGFLARYKGLSFYLWSVALLFTIGQTIDFIFLHGEGHWSVIAWLGLVALLFCVVQFALGKWIGSRYGDIIAGGQLLGQKNTAMGIWMANHYLHPLTSTVLAFYAILQNLFNSWQIWRHEKRKA